MRILGSILLTVMLSATGFAEDIFLMNGRVVDGSGKPRLAANVRIRDGEITDIGPLKPAATDTILDVKGLIVAPGFIDLQTLSPAAIAKDAAPAELILHGITTAVLGSDGTGPYSVEDFMLPFDEKPPALNIAMLAGHGTIRRQILGPDGKRAATSEELQRMSELLSDAMKQGAFGLAADLRSEPGSFSTPDELLTLAKVIARFGGTLVINLRTETGRPADVVKEAVTLAREAKVPVHVLTANKAAVAEVDRVRATRLDITAGSYTFADWIADKTVTIERAVQRMSSAPASRVALRERGMLKKGAPADIVIFNPTSIQAGMKYVFVNGVMILKEGQLLEARPGQSFR